MKLLALRDTDFTDLVAVLHVHRRDGWEVADRLLSIAQVQAVDPILGGTQARHVMLDIAADGFAMMARFDTAEEAAQAWREADGAAAGYVILCGWENPAEMAHAWRESLPEAPLDYEVTWP